jgi:hypothetical protein
VESPERNSGKKDGRLCLCNLQDRSDPEVVGARRKSTCAVRCPVAENVEAGNIIGGM